MAAVEFIAAAFVLVAVAFLFIDIAFRIERKVEPDSIIDFFDGIRLLFFSLGFYFALMALNFGRLVVINDTSSMESIFDTTTIIYTSGMILMVFIGLAYFFIIIPRLMKKMSIKKQREEEETISYDSGGRYG